MANTYLPTEHLALPKESKRRNKLSLVPNLTSNNFFPRNQEESVRKARNAKRAYLMSAGKERPSINSGFGNFHSLSWNNLVWFLYLLLVRLGSKVEKEKGQIHEDNLSKSIQNLRMRSTYSSGFGISTPSFMVSQKKTPWTKLRKYSPNAKNLTKHRVKYFLISWFCTLIKLEELKLWFIEQFLYIPKIWLF